MLKEVDDFERTGRRMCVEKHWKAVDSDEVAIGRSWSSSPGIRAVFEDRLIQSFKSDDKGGKRGAGKVFRSKLRLVDLGVAAPLN